MPSSIDSINIPGEPPIVPPIGSAQDVLKRLFLQLPVDWFGPDDPILNTVLQAYVSTGVFNYQQLAYDQLQMRLQTATEDNLDLISQDYFGGALPRRTGENDDTFRLRISANLLQERATRFGMSNALFILTGYYPKLFEPWNPLDCGAYNVANYPSSIGYSTHGSYGSGSYAYQGFIDVYLSQYEGMGSYSGYNNYYFGYNATGGLASGWYGGNSLLTAIVTDADIYQTINMTKVFGTICWVAIHRI